MIKFTLLCDNGHDFEGWFSSNDDFDGQKERGLVTCPMCDSVHVDKALMAPSVNVKRDHEAAKFAPSSPAMDASNPATSNPHGSKGHRSKDMTVSTPPALAHPTAPQSQIPQPSPEQVMQIAAQIEAVRKFRKKILKTSEDVGDNFTEEARKIHYGEAKPRGIYGEAKLEDIKELVEEGVDVLPLPNLPEDQN